MKRIVCLVPSVIILAFLFSACENKKESRITTKGLEVVDFRALPFDMDDVKLLDGPFKDATELNIQSVVKL